MSITFGNKKKAVHEHIYVQQKVCSFKGIDKRIHLVWAFSDNPKRKTSQSVCITDPKMAQMPGT